MGYIGYCLYLYLNLNHFQTVKNSHETFFKIFRFTDVVAKWPGATHDASVFDNSLIKKNSITIVPLFLYDGATKVTKDNI